MKHAEWDRKQENYKVERNKWSDDIYNSELVLGIVWKISILELQHQHQQ